MDDTITLLLEQIGPIRADISPSKSDRLLNCQNCGRSETVISGAVIGAAAAKAHIARIPDTDKIRDTVPV